jgi:hypothetical protein
VEVFGVHRKGSPFAAKPHEQVLKDRGPIHALPLSW